MAKADENKGLNLYPNLKGISEDDVQIEEDIPTKRIKVSKLPDKVTEDEITYFFENRKRSGGSDVDTVDYDQKTNTAIVIFQDEEDVQKVLDKCPLLFNEKHIEVEKYFIDEEPDETQYNECTIEVTGMNQTTSKNNVMLYFESKKGASDDVLSIIYMEEQEMYLVRFSSEDVVDAVLKKKHVLDGSELQVRKHIPLPPEATYPKQVSVSGFDAKIAEEVLINFLEARSKVDVDKVIYGDLEGAAIVIFKTQPDVSKLKEECKKKQLNGRYCKVDSVPLTKCIIVSSIKEGTTRDAVMYYFDNERKSGVEGVDDVELDSKNKTCIVYFVDSDAPVTACKREHTIEGHKVKVDLYYEVLGGTGSGDGPKFTPPDPIDLVLDVKKIQFLTNSKTGKNELEQQLKVCHARVKTWPALKTGTLKIECTITADVKDCKKLVKNWETDVNKDVDKVMNNLHKEEHQTLQEEWKPVMDKVRGINISKPDLVALSVESSQCEMVIVGYKQQVTELSRQLKSIITDVKAGIEKKKQQLKEKISLKYHQIMILVMVDFPKRMMKSFKDLDVKTNIDSCEMTLEGLSKDVTAAKLKMYEEELKNVSRVPAGPLSKYTAAFLNAQEVKDFVMDQFKRKKKIGIWEIEENDLVMYGRSDREANDCVKIFRSAVIETAVGFDNNQLSLLKSDVWKQEVKRITDKYPKNLVLILYDTNGKIMILCTSSRDAGIIREDIEQFVRHNTTNNTSLELSPGERKLLDSPYFNEKFKAIEKDLEKDKVQINLGHKSVSIKGNVKGLPSAKSKVEAIIAAISIKNHVISKPGITKFMTTEQGKSIVKMTEKNVGVVIDIMIDGEKRMDLGLGERQPTMISFNPTGLTETSRCDIRGGRIIVTVLGDITQLSTDVIVNAANDELDHRGGLAKVIVDKGGKDIQTECSEYITQHGKLSEGGVYCSKPGKLKCKMIVHVVGPVWKGGKNDEEEALADCIRHTMEAADKKSFVSIAIPAISTGVYGYPKEKATKVIIKALHDYFNSNTKSKIKRICLCDLSDDTIRYFVGGMKKYFGNVRHLVDPEETINPWRNQTEQHEVLTGGHGKNEGIVTFGNISVRVVKGQLAKQKVDVIVNSTSSDLRLEAGMLSKSLLIAAGQTLQNECNKKYPNGIKDGEVARTSGGNLSCKEVFHGCLPSWQYEQSSIKILEEFVKECLDICTKTKHRSIAFPSLGTGKLGYPVDQVAKHMFSCVERFSSDAPNSSIKDVLFVVYDEDHKSIGAFEDEKRRKSGCPKRAEERFSKENHHGKEPAERGRPKSARPGTAQGRQFVVDLNSIQLRVYQGDITTARVDVIVNSCNTDCDLSKGAVAQAILKRGGREVTADINKQKDKMKKEGMVVTTGGKLACDKIIHLDMQNSTIDLKTKIFKVLKMTDGMSKYKVAIPALGTANANIPIETVAMEMLGVIYNYRPRSIQEVHVVIYQSSMLKSFIDASGKCMEKIKSNPTGVMATVVENMGIGPKSATRRKRELKKTEPTNSSEFSVVVFGKNKSDTDEAVKELEKSIFKEFMEKLVKGKIIKEFSKEQENDLKKLEILEGVEIKVDKEKIIVRGFMVNLSPALGKVNDIVKIAELNKQAGQKAKLVSESVQWYFICNENGKDELKEYPSYINLQLEQDFNKMEEKSIMKDNSGNKFIVDFTSLQEYPEKDKNDCVQVVRKSKVNSKDTTFEPPAQWDTMEDKQDYQVVVLKTSVPEYTDVMNKFHRSVGNQRPIVEIHRIQNKTLYQQYIAKKKSIESTNPPGHQNEKTLWHGFAIDAMESINRFGFNRSYCGKNATAYGDGVYFARDANYSVRDTYSVPDSNGNKRMYMCKVLTGEYTSGSGGMRTPPQKPSPEGTHILYDCVVDSPHNPGMYIIFHDVQAYPEYMILFQ